VGTADAEDAVSARRTIAARAAQELMDGQVVNLGAGIPMLVADYLPHGMDVAIQAENGLVRGGPLSEPGTEEPDRRNAGNLPVSLMPGGCYVDSALSFGLIRGGHVDATMIGTLQVDGCGNIANYAMPGRQIGMGGAMDLVAGAARVYVLTEHCAKDGSAKLVKRCSLPLTGACECDVIITERALFRRHPGAGFQLEETARGFSLDSIRQVTAMDYDVANDVRIEAY
jgi:3-oxoacid CoA-transferase B subunit